jgi:AAA domain/UvrD-like helicase C-terminal domain
MSAFSRQALVRRCAKLPWAWIDEERALPWIEKRSGLQLADSQRAAIRLAPTAKALVITGAPGVGKTTIVNSILKILAAKGVRLLLCAPTGRAAKRMTEATGVEAKTIHRLLEVDPRSGGFKRNADYPLDCELLVIDEASMVDVMLMQALMKATPDNAVLLIVGDIDQLPSVGPGQVLADVIGSGVVPVVRLIEVFRQAAASQIIINAHRISQGAMPSLSAPAGESDFYFVPAEDPETAVQRILELVKIRVPKRFGLTAIRDIQVLCPMNRGGVGARQGSEYPAVVIPVLTQHYAMLQRNLLYTGVTRGKRLVVLVGHRDRSSQTFPGGDAGQNSTNGFASARRAPQLLLPPRAEARWRWRPAGSPTGLAVLRRLGMRNAPAAQEVPGGSAVRTSLIVANCLTRSAALAGLSQWNSSSSVSRYSASLSVGPKHTSHFGDKRGSSLAKAGCSVAALAN